jgi:hypothetical protein
MFTCNLTDVTWNSINVSLEASYIIAAAFIYCKYGRQNIIEKFKKSGRKLSFFFGIQKWYLIIFVFTWFVQGIQLANEFFNEFDWSYNTRMSIKFVCAIVYSLRPTLLLIPWACQAIISYCQQRPREQLIQRSEALRGNMNDALREEIAEYLLKGMNKSVNAILRIDIVREKTTSLRIKNDLKESVLGQAAIQKVNLVSKAAIARAAKEELPMIIAAENQLSDIFVFEDERNEDDEGIRFVELGPKIFENLRKLHNVSAESITNLFSVRNLHAGRLKVKLQSGKGGAFFITPIEGNYLIKSITAEEYDVMGSILFDYYIHFANCPSTYINPIYGCYALRLSDTEEIEPMYFVLMKNVLEIDKNLLPANAEIHCFDIKGSTAGRQTLEHPEKLFEPNVYRRFRNIVLKDSDFFETYKTLLLLPLQASKIISELTNDSILFRRHDLIDYSLLLYIVNIPCKTMGTKQESIEMPSDNLMREEVKDTVFKLAISQSINPDSPFILQERAAGNTNLVYRLEGVSNTLKAALLSAANNTSDVEGRSSLSLLKQSEASVIPLTPIRRCSLKRSLIKGVGDFKGGQAVIASEDIEESNDSIEDIEVVV